MKVKRKQMKNTKKNEGDKEEANEKEKRRRRRRDVFYVFKLNKRISRVAMWKVYAVRYLFEFTEQSYHATEIALITRGVNKIFGGAKNPPDYTNTARVVRGPRIHNNNRKLNIPASYNTPGYLSAAKLHTLTHSLTRSLARSVGWSPGRFLCRYTTRYHGEFAIYIALNFYRFLSHRSHGGGRQHFQTLSTSNVIINITTNYTDSMYIFWLGFCACQNRMKLFSPERVKEMSNRKRKRTHFSSNRNSM